MKYPVPVTDRGMKMDIYSGVLWIVGVLAAVLMIGAFKSRTEMVVNFILRGVLGMLMIYFGTYLFSGQMPGIEIGYNPITFLASGALGFPGVLMLYGIHIYMMI